jgi:hypothetical protein
MILPTCDGVRDALPDALAGTLPREETQPILAHVAGCADCSAEAELLRALLRHPERAPAGLAERVRAAAPRRSWPGLPPRRALLLAAVVAGALLGGGVLLRSQLHDAASPVATAPSASTADASVDLDGRSLMQALPGTGEGVLYSSSATLDDLSEAELRELLKELRS